MIIGTGKKIKESSGLPKVLTVGLFTVVYILYFSFGFYHITKFATADETIWWLYSRVPMYWSAWASGDWKNTYINDKPGISVALISGIGYNLTRDNFQEKIQERLGTPNIYKRAEKQDLNVEKNLLALRLPLLIFNGFFSLFLFWLLKKITGDFWVSFWSFCLILLSPILLGISQIMNPDTLLWSFSAGTLFSFLAYLKTEKKLLAAAGSACLGMAILSKYAATIFFPFIIFVTFLHFSQKIKEWRESGEKIHAKIRNISLASVAIIAGSVLLYSIGMPAVFTDKNLLLQGTIGYPGMEYFLWPLFGIQIALITESFFFKNKFSIFIFERAGKFLKKYSGFIYLFLAAAFVIVLANWISGIKIQGLKDLPFDRGTSEKFSRIAVYKQFFYEIRPMVFSLTPITLFALLFFWIKSFIKKTFNFAVLIFSLFFLAFYAAVIFQGLMVTIRYSIMLYPLALVIAAFGVKELYKTGVIKKISVFLFSLIIIFISAVSLWLIKPFYFNYTSDLLPKKYLITGAWGYGGYEAAQYINSLPNSENLTTWSDYPGVCEFTKGKCYITNRIDNRDIDYFVLTRRGRLVYSYASDRTGAKEYYKQDNPEWFLRIDDRPDNYIKVFKNSDK